MMSLCLTLVVGGAWTEVSCDDHLGAGVFPSESNRIITVELGKDGFSRLAARRHAEAGPVRSDVQVGESMVAQEVREGLEQGLLTDEMDVGIALTAGFHGADRPITVDNPAPKIARRNEVGTWDANEFRHQARCQQAATDLPGPHAQRIPGAPFGGHSVMANQGMGRAQEATQPGEVGEVLLGCRYHKARCATFARIYTAVGKGEAHPVSRLRGQDVERGIVERMNASAKGRDCDSVRFEQAVNRLLANPKLAADRREAFAARASSDDLCLGIGGNGVARPRGNTSADEDVVDGAGIRAVLVRERWRPNSALIERNEPRLLAIIQQAFAHSKRFAGRSSIVNNSRIEGVVC